MRSREVLGEQVSRWLFRAGTTFRRGQFWQLVLIVGLVSGLIGAAYIAVMNEVGRLLGPGHWSRSWHLLVLVLVGVAIGALTEVLGSAGETELLVDNIHVAGGPEGIRELRSLIPVSLLGIGAGSAIGPEAPLVQTTGSASSWVARRQGLGANDRRTLTITGMAAGFTVLFGAPLGSAVFALEILHRRGLEYYEALLPAGLGSLSGYTVYVLVRRVKLGTVWHFPQPHDLRPVALLVGLGAGVVGAAVAIGFTYFTKLMRRTFRPLPATVQPVAGGLLLGGLAFVSPYALTFGEGQIQHVIDHKLLVGTLLLAVAAKFMASSMIMSSGWRGGFIIPMFFIGVALGSAATRALGTDPAVAMTAVMVATNVGVTKTPFGSTLVVAEMAGLRVLPSALLAGMVALALTSRVSLIRTQRERAGP